MRSDENIREIMKCRKENGLEGEMPQFIMAQDDPIPVLIPTTPEMDFPVSVPESFTACGPILRPWTPVADAHPELNAWLSKRPTVVVNLGSIFRYSSALERQFAEGIRMLLDKRPDIQILWKLPRDQNMDHDGSSLDGISDAVAEGRVRIEKWFPRRAHQYPSARESAVFRPPWWSEFLLRSYPVSSDSQIGNWID